MGNRLILGLLAGAVLTAALTACGGSDDDAATGDATQAPQATSAAAATTPAAGGAAAVATQAPAAPQTISVKAGEYFFDPKEYRVRPGAITVTMTNEGPERPHTFVVKNRSGDGDLAKTDRVPVNANSMLEFTLTEEGTYEVYCNLPGHADRGQRGTITVARS